MLTAEFWQMTAQGLWETFYMVALSALFSYIIGLPLGLVLAVIMVRVACKPEKGTPAQP